MRSCDASRSLAGNRLTPTLGESTEIARSGDPRHDSRRLLWLSRICLSNELARSFPILLQATVPAVHSCTEPVLDSMHLQDGCRGERLHVIAHELVVLN
jgi:hypothetical protein